MQRFLAVEPQLVTQPLDPQFGDRYLRPDRIARTLSDYYDGVCSHADRMRFMMVVETRADLIATLNDYVHSGAASVEDILRLEQDTRVNMMLLGEKDRTLIAEEATGNVILTCAESALQEDPIYIMDYLWPEAVEHAKRNGCDHLHPGSITLNYIEHCMQRTHGEDIRRVIGQL